MIPPAFIIEYRLNIGGTQIDTVRIFFPRFRKTQNIDRQKIPKYDKSPLDKNPSDNDMTSPGHYIVIIILTQSYFILVSTYYIYTVIYVPLKNIVIVN